MEILGAEELSDFKGISEEVVREVVYPPGFRFSPTDEELVGFFLRRKVESKPLFVEIIKQVDIYKYDPWDLARKLFLSLPLSLLPPSLSQFNFQLVHAGVPKANPLPSEWRHPQLPLSKKVVQPF